MIILPEQRAVVVATPRTGSRSINEAIISANPKGMLVVKPHHNWPHEVTRAACGANCEEKGAYDVYTIIREPLSQLASWLNHTRKWHDQEKFVAEYRTRYFCYDGYLNIYVNVATKFFVFEDGGHQKLINALGLDVQIPRVGKSENPEVYKNVLSDESKRIARVRFRNDFELYKQITHESGS